jgi:hypothetical protein
MGEFNDPLDHFCFWNQLLNLFDENVALEILRIQF